MLDSKVFFATCIAPLVEAFFILGVFNELADRARLQTNLARSHLLLAVFFLTIMGAVKIDGRDGSSVGKLKDAYRLPNIQRLCRDV
jgi:hypothetical protein